MCEDRILFTLPVVGNFTDGTKYPSEGLVKDPAGEAIIGASVVVKGTTNGSITDLDGKFSLSDVRFGSNDYRFLYRLPLSREESIRYTHGVYSERRH